MPTAGHDRIDLRAPLPEIDPPDAMRSLVSKARASVPVRGLRWSYGSHGLVVPQLAEVHFARSSALGTHPQFRKCRRCCACSVEPAARARSQLPVPAQSVRAFLHRDVPGRCVWRAPETRLPRACSLWWPTAGMRASSSAAFSIAVDEDLLNRFFAEEG